MSDNSSASAPRLHFIDGLRGLAMLMVLLFHCATYSDGWHTPGNLLAFVGYGHIGVNLFLVLSGFCLYWPFVKQNAGPKPTLWQFTRKRCQRILPPYYVALMLFWLFLLWDVLTHHHIHEDATNLPHVIKSLFWHLTMLYNLRPEYIESVNGPFWSLGLEFSLYILFPVLVEAFRRFGPVRTLLVVLGVSMVYRIILAAQCPAQTLTGAEQFTLYYSLFGRGFEFAMGMMTAHILAKQVGKTMKWAGWVCAFSGLVAVLLTQKYGLFSPFTDVLWGICGANLILAASQPGHRTNVALSHPWIVQLGIFSYSVYLIHQPIVKALDKLAMHHHWSSVIFGFLVITPLALSLGYIFHLLFEKPFMRQSRSRMGFAFSAEPPLPMAVVGVQAK